MESLRDDEEMQGIGCRAANQVSSRRPSNVAGPWRREWRKHGWMDGGIGGRPEPAKGEPAIRVRIGIGNMMSGNTPSEATGRGSATASAQGLDMLPPRLSMIPRPGHGQPNSTINTSRFSGRPARLEWQPEVLSGQIQLLPVPCSCSTGELWGLYVRTETQAYARRASRAQA